MNLLKREVLLVDKPAGISSFGVVARVRRVLTEQKREQVRREWAAAGKRLEDLPKSALPKRVKVGHAGTLDPFATGLLICLLGKGTKRAGEFLKLDKRYEATIRLGATSTTGDIEGEISESKSAQSQRVSRGPAAAFSPTCALKALGGGPPSGVTPRQPVTNHRLACDIPDISFVADVVEGFRGEIVQKVPAYSAVKINGRRAYDLARKGVKVEMPERKVKIYEISVVDYKWPELKIECKVSSGTYIRALGKDIGEALGVGGYLTALRRTEIGNFKVSEAVRLEEIMD